MANPLQVALFAAAVLTATVSAPAQTPPAREAQVLALLRRIPMAHSHLYATPVAAATNAYGCSLVAPALQGLCGTGWRPAFDPAFARQLAAELARIYGLAPAVGAPAPGGVAARLDVFDAAQGIGLELRGAVEERSLEHGGTWPRVVDEHAADDLDATEHRALLAANVRVHTVDVQSFWTAHSLDRLTTTLCYLASVGAFLNEVTSGEDVDWSALVPHDGRRLPFELPKPGGGLVVEQWSGGGGCTLVVAKALEVRLAIDPARATALRPGRAAGALANDGRPVALQLLGGSDGGGGCSLALRQAGKDGRERELATSRTEVLFAPGAFDTAQPFTLVLSLQPGQYRLNDTAWIGGAPAKSR